MVMKSKSLYTGVFKDEHGNRLIGIGGLFKTKEEAELETGDNCLFTSMLFGTKCDGLMEIKHDEPPLAVKNRFMGVNVFVISGPAYDKAAAEERVQPVDLDAAIESRAA